MSIPHLTVTTSWDDGHPADGRLSELLLKYQVRGTFYVPCRNCEGRNVMTKRDLLALSQQFELGCHTMDHVVLTTVDPARAEGQIRDSKTWLEDVIGRPIHGFCYPRGKYNSTIKSLTKSAGFEYARTVKNFCMDVGSDQFEMPTTLQFFPHMPTVYLQNYIKHGLEPVRLRLFLAALRGGPLIDRVKRLANLCAESGGLFHLWGHSWEIEEHDLWCELEVVLKYLSETFQDANFIDNYTASSAITRNAV
jgi:peptidoglycan/xylan/chitin deacetylase (PgdA/CDA1 family)